MSFGRLDDLSERIRLETGKAPDLTNFSDVVTDPLVCPVVTRRDLEQDDLNDDDQRLPWVFFRIPRLLDEEGLVLIAHRSQLDRRAFIVAHGFNSLKCWIASRVASAFPR